MRQIAIRAERMPIDAAHQCLKCRRPVNDHRKTVLVGGRDDFGVSHRPTRLHDRRRAGGGDRVETVTEREERVRCRHTARPASHPLSSPRP